MKKVLFVIPVLLLAAGMWLWKSSESAEKLEMAAQSVQDPETKLNAREAYEYNRAKDPATGMIPDGIRALELKFAERLPRVGEGERGVGWIRRGPFNIGGRTRALAIDINDVNVINAGGVSGGMWRTDDGGTTWTKTTNPAQIHSVSSVVQDPRPGKENIWYHGTGEEAYGIVSGTSFTSIFSGDGMFKSTDGGQSWTQLESTASGTPQSVQDGTYDFIWNIVVDHTNLEEDVVLAAVYNGIIRSTDGGETWTEVHGFNATPSQFVDIMQTPGGVFYSAFSADGLGRGIYRSEDGITWNEIDFPLGGLYRRIVMTYNPQNENEVYFILEGPTDENDINHALFKYTYIDGDGSGEGGNWEERSANLPQTPCELFIGANFDFGTFGSQGSYDLCIAHHPTEEDVLYIGGRNVFRSTNAFATDDQTSWIGGYRCNTENPRDYTYPQHHSDQHVITFSPTDPSVMFTGNDGGVQRTDDCLADSVIWTTLNNGYVTSQFYTVALEQGNADSDFIMGGMQDNGTWGTGSLEFAEMWKEVHNDDGAHCAVPEGREYVISSSQRGRMYIKQLDENGNVTAAKRIDPANNPSGIHFINPFILDPQNHHEIYMAGGNTLWRMQRTDTVTLDNDLLNPIDNDYWQNFSASFVGFSGGDITALDKPKVDHTVIYYGTDRGRIWKVEDIYGDPVKTEITGNGFPSNAWMSSISANDLNRDEVMACHSNYNVKSIWHTNDGGENWADVSGNLEENPDGTGAGPAVYSVAIYPSDPPVYYAGTSAGLFSTTELDGENTVWSMEGEDVIGNVVINMVESRAFDGTVVIATHGNGMYSTSLDPVAAIGVEEGVQPDFALTAYPNPFINELRFRYEVEEAGAVSLVIIDQQGRQVVQEELGVQSAGQQEFIWTGGNELSEGLYSYVLRIGHRSRTGKILKRGNE